MEGAELSLTFFGNNIVLMSSCQLKTKLEVVYGVVLTLECSRLVVTDRLIYCFPNSHI